MATATKRPKKQKIRNNEYYDTQALFDDLYAKSQRKHIFKDLMQYITSNRISLYVGQQGRCYVTGEPLRIGEMEVHHKKRRRDGGGDLYANLVWVSAGVHKLIHATGNATIEFYLKRLHGTKIDFLRLNQLRKLVGNCDIDSNK